MAVKTAFEPKDARINFDDRYYSDDFDEKREPRKRITGTQALVEFLNTTSPEEFQKNVPKRSSTLFFRRRGEKPTKSPLLSKSSATSTTSSPHTIHRKNYIEIIANPFTFSKNSKIDNNPSPDNEKASVAKNNHAAIIGSQLNRTLSKSTSIYSLPHHNDKPVLPIRKGFNSNGTQTTAASTTTGATGTATAFNRRQFPSLRTPTLADHTTKNYQPAHSIFTATTLNNDHNDLIEEGLKQRLQQYQINSLDKPGDAVSKSLAQEHIAALGVVSSMIMDEQIHEEEERTKMKKKKKSRHIQVQTMPYYPNESNNNVAVTVQTEPMNSIESNDTELKQRLKKIEHELKQEQLKNSRLQAALEETRDQFEVLSGLAYKKLREVWEEKTRWENACIEAKERCWHDHHKQIMGRHANTSEDGDMSSCFVDGTIMDFMLDTEVERASNQEEEEEDLI